MSVNALSKEEVAELVAAAGGLQKADVMQYFCNEPLLLPRINVAPLKSIMSQMKSLHGFNFNLNKNKGGLTADFLTVVRQLPTTKAERLSNANQGALTHAVGTSALPRGHTLAAAPPRPPVVVQPVQAQSAIAGPRGPVYNQSVRVHTAPTSTVPRPVAIPPRPHFQQAQPRPAAVQPRPAFSLPVNHPHHAQFAAAMAAAAGGYGVHPAAYANYPRGFFGNPAQLQAPRQPYPDNFNRAVYDEMKQLPGLHKHEIKDAMKMVPPNETTFDSVLEKIIAKRQSGSNTASEADMDALSTALYDRTIRVSEGERDAGQERKRKKVSDLKNDMQCLILAYEDFEHSVLLWGLPQSSMKVTSSSSSSSSSFHANNGTINPAQLQQGCRTLRLLSLLFDYAAAEDERQEMLIQLFTMEATPLRVLVVELLLIEQQAIKYYSHLANPFLLSLAHQLDHNSSYGHHINDLTFEAEWSDIRREEQINDEEWQVIWNVVMQRMTPMRDALQQCKSRFERGMSKIPKDESRVPELLRKKSLKPFMDLLKSKVELDGIEEEESNMALISDVETVVTIDDFDDDDDYDE